MSELIDTTEMYLRTIFELTEEGIRPMRARIAERLGQSGPTVSQTVGRMQRDGLVELDRDDRHLVLTPLGARAATRVMRKHRLAECLLVQVIGLPWERVHPEACRWEHVMSEEVERRLVALLGDPRVSPFGNPIPGLAELGAAAGSAGLQSAGTGEQPPGDSAAGPAGEPLAGTALSAVVREGERQRVTVLRIAESLQSEEAVMEQLRRLGATPGSVVEVVGAAGVIRLGDSLELVPARARQIAVATA